MTCNFLCKLQKIQDFIMKTNTQRLARFLSEPCENYAYIKDDDQDKSIISIPKKDFLRQLSKEAEQKIDQSERENQLVSDILQQPKFTRLTSISNDDNNNNNPDIIVESISPHVIIETGLQIQSSTKTSSQRFRWNLLFNLILWLIVPLPLWIPFISNQLAIYLLPSIQLLFVIIWMGNKYLFILNSTLVFSLYLVIGILAMKNMLILYFKRSFNYSEEINKLENENEKIRHIVAICCYKEPIELIATSIETVAKQTEVNRIILVVSFEEKTPDKDEKCKYLDNKFKTVGFERIIFTIHPKGLPNEIPGKCSNSNYGLRMAIKQMNIADNDINQMKHILVTTCDADSKFPPNYISALTYKYLKENKPALTTIYQSPLFYNWKLDQLSFITRVTGLLRSLLMLGALIPFNINTMSIFSYSLALAKQGNFIHPAYQMDDIICLIRWMGVTQQRLKISMIPVPVISGPTSGQTIEIEIIEWARQIRRWTIGAAEVFHYFIIKAKRIPFIASFSWGMVFIIYYGILLCTAGLFNLTSTLSMFLLVKNVPIMISYLMYGILGMQMLTFLFAFIIDGLITRLFHIDECIFILRNFFHFLTTPFVLLAYSFIELYALHEIVIFGKKVCKHGASTKTNLN